ncbi:2-amino-4-hydroxy-6-hydroxymethyldihydropteridine diphosphokinase [Thermoproteota archaeon]
MPSIISYLGIGSNLGDRLANIKDAMGFLDSLSSVHIEKASPIYETPPQGGPRNQPNYFNTAIKIETTLSPLDLLNQIKIIEKRMKRKKGVRWGSRKIDLDVLFYGDFVLQSKSLSVPHSLLHKRIFVLRPLFDIEPNLIHPLLGKNVSSLFRKYLHKNLRKVAVFN